MNMAGSASAVNPFGNADSQPGPTRSTIAIIRSPAPYLRLLRCGDLLGRSQSWSLTLVRVETRAPFTHPCGLLRATAERPPFPGQRSAFAHLHGTPSETRQ